MNDPLVSKLFPTFNHSKIKFKKTIVMKKIFFAGMSIVSIISCNSSADKTSENMDTTTHNMDMTSTVTMPPMPEVPANAKVYFANLKDGQTVTSPLKIEMAVEALSVDTANGKI